MTERQSRALVSGWTMTGVAGILAWAAFRLGTRGLATIQGGLAWVEWSVLILLTVAFVYGEGVRAMERRWVPRVVERARRIRDEHVAFRLLAPLYGLSLLGEDAGEVARGWLGAGAIVVAVLIVRSFPEPWRGIVDFAVASALAWGTVAILRRLPSTVAS